MLRASSLSRRFASKAQQQSRQACLRRHTPPVPSPKTPSAVERGKKGKANLVGAVIEEDFIRQHSHSFPVGRPWRSLPIPTIESRGRSLYQKRLDLVAQEKHLSAHSLYVQKILGLQGPIPLSKRLGKAVETWSLDTPRNIQLFRKNHLRVIGESQTQEEAWSSFSALSTPPFTHVAKESGQNTKIPLAHLHRLARLLSRTKPKTQTIFRHLVEVLRFIQTSDGTVHLHEWNALIDNSGKGWRKTRLDEFTLALTVFKDMIAGNKPKTHLSHSSRTRSTPVKEIPTVPDIYTYNTLITIASRTGNSGALRQATELMLSAGLSPDRITHLSMLKFFVITKQISGVRSTLSKMRQQGLAVGLDGINGALWGFAHVGRLDVILDAYRVLRHNLKCPDTYDADVERISRHLLDEENIHIPPDMTPDERTFHLVMQIFAYSGDLIGALNVLQDMMTTLNTEVGAPLFKHPNGRLLPHNYHPSIPVFRAIFLGYSRHAVSPESSPGQSGAAWNLDNLNSLFRTFLEQPDLGNVAQSMVYWIMVAFIKASGNDQDLLREVWFALEKKFDGPWGTPENRLQKIRKQLFPSFGPYEKLSLD